MQLTIRDARDADEVAVVDLWRRCDLVVSYNDPHADFRFALAGAASTVLVGVDEADVVRGSVMVGHDGHRGWMHYVSADPDMRANGVGRQMVSAAETWLRQRGVPKVHLLVRPTNTKVIGFYERLGYEEQPRVLMAKWLND